MLNVLVVFELVGLLVLLACDLVGLYYFGVSGYYILFVVSCVRWGTIVLLFGFWLIVCYVYIIGWLVWRCG